MGVRIEVSREVENRKTEGESDFFLELIFDCYRCSEYFGEYPTGGRQTWIEADLVEIKLDGKDIDNDTALREAMGLSEEDMDKVLDSMQTEASEQFKDGE